MSTPSEVGLALDARGTRRQTRDALIGVLIGTAVGDSLGLPMEGLSARRQQKLFRPPMRQRLVGGFGMISDDTEHTFLLAQSLLACPDHVAEFQRDLARRLRWWLLSLPAGVGLATLRAILKLWLGVPPSRSGVRSAGNGAAMRSALLGVYFRDDAARREAFARASAEITHRDPRAIIAARAVTEVAQWMAEGGDDHEGLLQSLGHAGEHAEWSTLLPPLRQGLLDDAPVTEFAKTIGAVEGVSGYAFGSVPVAIYAAVRHRDDFSAAIADVIACGGDTDTTAAIAGALVGARVGLAGIPAEWHARIAEYPRSIAVLQRIGETLSRQLEAGSFQEPVRYFWPAIPLRNLVFLAIVLAHGFRRLLPPY
jgi:ADP-ribosyl-[dinitrogen reductase] hydrolase